MKLVAVYCAKPDFAYIFSEDGVQKVFLADGSRIDELDENTHCCALVNLGYRLMQVPEQFYPSERLRRVVIATSSNEAHLSKFAKEHPGNTYYMPTWGWDDLYRCRSVRDPS